MVGRLASSLPLLVTHNASAKSSATASLLCFVVPSIGPVRSATACGEESFTEPHSHFSHSTKAKGRAAAIEWGIGHGELGSASSHAIPVLAATRKSCLRVDHFTIPAPQLRRQLLQRRHLKCRALMAVATCRRQLGQMHVIYRLSSGVCAVERADFMSSSSFGELMAAD